MWAARGIDEHVERGDEMGELSIRLRPVVEEDLAMFRRFAIEPFLIGLDWAGFRDAQAPARNGTNGEAVSLAEMERRHIESVLSRTHWHQGRAATVLGISSKTLYRKIREYGFHRPRAANGG